MNEINALIIKMTEYYRGDPKRIQHFIKVYEFARVWGGERGLMFTTSSVLAWAG